MPALKRLLFIAVLSFSIFQIAGTALSTALSEHRCEASAQNTMSVDVHSMTDDCGNGHCGFVCGNTGHGHITQFLTSTSNEIVQQDDLRVIAKPIEFTLPSAPHLSGLLRPPRA